MQIQITLDTNSRKDVELAHNALGYILGFLPAVNSEAGAAALTAAKDNTPAADPVPATPAVTEPLPTHITGKTETKPKATRAKKGEAKPEAAKTTGEKISLADARAKLTDYSADSRYGMAGVLKLLGEFGLESISKLPENRYGEFVALIDERLAANPLA